MPDVSSIHRRRPEDSQFRRNTYAAGTVSGDQIDSAFAIPGRPLEAPEYQNRVRNPYGLLPRPPQTQAAHFKRLYRN
jgi:hypothetical protein